MFGASKRRNQRAIEVSAKALSGCINGLTMSWYGRIDVKINRISDVLFDSYVQGFLFAVANLNLHYAMNERALKKSDKIPMLEEVFANGFGVEKEDLIYWMEEVVYNISGNGDSEFQRGVLNGIILTSFIKNQDVQHEEIEMQRILTEARSMRDPGGWLVAKLWFEELERLKPASTKWYEA